MAEKEDNRTVWISQPGGDVPNRIARTSTAEGREQPQLYVRRLVTLTFPDEDSNLGQHTHTRGREFFLASLDYRDLEIKFASREPKDWQDAYSAALRFDTYKKTSSRAIDGGAESVSVCASKRISTESSVVESKLAKLRVLIGENAE